MPSQASKLDYSAWNARRPPQPPNPAQFHSGNAPTIGLNIAGPVGPMQRMNQKIAQEKRTDTSTQPPLTIVKEEASIVLPNVTATLEMLGEIQ